MSNPLDNIVIDGTEFGEPDNDMVGDGPKPPFALFSPDLQCNIGGPYAEKAHAEAALQAMKDGKLNPYFPNFAIAKQWNELVG